MPEISSEQMMDKILDQWHERYFDGRLSANVLNILGELAISSHSEIVQGIIERQFKALQKTHVSAVDFSDYLAELMGLIPHLVSDAWDGVTPPITAPGRHIKIDDYLIDNQWWQLPAEGRLLDIGCGFPPVTTIELAQKLPDWHIVGADPVMKPF